MMWVEKCDNKTVGGMRVRRRDTRIWFVMMAVFFAVFLFTFLKNNFDSTDEVEAANLANFDPGNIISDYQMSRYDAMTEEEIQAFLTAKNPCNNTKQGDYEYLTIRYPNLKWHFENGHFVCLSEEFFGDGETIGEGETAAHIIWQAAQDYQINPQVLIVLLQKEQGLITDTYPNSRQYRAATGYGCPDTAACSEKYYGFKNQVRNAAGMFRAVLNGGWTNYPLGENYIQYNPNKDCGGSVVNVRNLATSALYRYTPYQPNAGALAAGYGTAYCGSYGNRNFYHYFEDWFSGITDGGAEQSEIEKFYELAGGQKSYLGVEESNEVCGLAEGGCYKVFENGFVYWTKKTGAHSIRKGKVFDYWFEQGTEWGTLGYPVGELEELSDGFRQKFEKGLIYGKEEIGVWGITGVILKEWQNLKAEEGVLGYPTSSEQKNENGLVYQTFEHGTIYWDVKTGAWVISDFATKKWEELGGVKSKLRKITTEGYCGLINGGCYQAFETGNIYWSEKTGSFDVSGGIYQTYLKNGTEWGVLGYPTSSEQKNENGLVYQTFEHGTIYWDVKTGAWVEIR